VIAEIGLADPAVIQFDGAYYLYATGDNWSYDVYHSSDLIHWTKGPKVFQPNMRNVWAPDIFHDKRSGKFYLFYTAGYNVGVAVAEGPAGTFVNQGLVLSSAIDANMFQDDDERYYLYYVALPGFRILVQKMESPLRMDGEPIEIIRPTAKWEMRGHPVTEAPWMLKNEDVYYLLYSGSAADTVDYAIGYATAMRPTGPFVKHDANPIIEGGGGIWGPGHGSVIRDHGGNHWLLYHQQKDDTAKWNRFICIDRLWFDAEGVLHGQATRDTLQAAPEILRRKVGFVQLFEEGDGP
jgi:beta-xylosidase